ncbi:GNAT family N-acetyltransferase [Nocardioides sp. cx-173]|uniref:GNAT family N-acetyltransferase n=1 Tax=Nocardioides sp. cx-173 TaxID=2898796 RepID=UPI001E4D4128|nr:GNAT family N-acetyltransferase [Nocardioides sp. cx-173]MCD4526481.1 GNAT family N-acetyltransferase [Nocardioides sp. cx-173]UGB41169.1 GNAT family N-acetyltransferase [Nocardioides sp. cx-173]
MTLEVSTDPARLDVGLIHRWLSEDAYWAIGRSREVVERAIEGSLSFGAYDDGRQVGYARVVTDRATFAWVCDVYVDRAARGHGVGKALVAAIDATLRGLGVRRAMLATEDAHALYAAVGFAPLPDQHRWLLRTYEP